MIKMDRYTIFVDARDFDSLVNNLEAFGMVPDEVPGYSGLARCVQVHAFRRRLRRRRVTREIGLSIRHLTQKVVVYRESIVQVHPEHRPNVDEWE